MSDSIVNHSFALVVNSPDPLTLHQNAVGALLEIAVSTPEFVRLSIQRCPCRVATWRYVMSAALKDFDVSTLAEKFHIDARSLSADE